MSERAVNREQLVAWALAEADGWRQVHPDELGALTAVGARSQLRAENERPAETLEEATAAQQLLAAGFGSDEEAAAEGNTLTGGSGRSRPAPIGGKRD